MILLTGASGFIGKHLLKKLKTLYGHDQVIALTAQPLSGSRYLIHDGYHFGEGFFKKNGLEGISSVIHAGAFTPKNGVQANEWENCNSNIINTNNLLKSLPEDVESFIFLSTLDVYGDTDIITENSPVIPISLYGHSKLYGEKMVERWAVDNGKVCQVLRIGHVYGPGEEQYQKIIPNTIKKLIGNLPLQITGTGSDIRSFIYIDDVVAAIANALNLESYKGPINIVGEKSISIKDIVLGLQKIAGNTSSIEYIASDKPIRNLYFDSKKMKEFLHKEEYSLLDGLRSEWDYMTNLK